MHLLLMGRKSGANEGPVHSPIGRRHLKKRKGTKQETQQNKQETKQANSSKVFPCFCHATGHI